MDADPPLPDMDDLIDLSSVLAEFQKLSNRSPRSAVRCNRCASLNRACVSNVIAQTTGQPCDPCMGTSTSFQCSFVLDDPMNMRVPHTPLPQVEPLAAAVAQRLPVVVEAQRTLQLLTVLANLQVAKYTYYLLDYVHAFRTAVRRLGGVRGLQQRGLLSYSVNPTETTAMSPSTLYTLEQFFTAATGSDIQAIGASHPLLLAQESYGIGGTNVPHSFFENIAGYRILPPVAVPPSSPHHPTNANTSATRIRRNRNCTHSSSPLEQVD
ncbi:hypothetical protein BDQ17DRAFT_1368153 [Cyathus striatus]|nr:hypothetical protein BDQ17DRAFT_1368153 [Cyathus striatus]